MTWTCCFSQRCHMAGLWHMINSLPSSDKEPDGKTDQDDSCYTADLIIRYKPSLTNKYTHHYTCNLTTA